MEGKGVLFKKFSGINVFDMRTDISSAPMSADPLFSASAGIQPDAYVIVHTNVTVQDANGNNI